MIIVVGCGTSKTDTMTKTATMNVMTEEEDEGASRQWELTRSEILPMGTVAYYGPDDKTATKIAAAVFLQEDADPILQRWVASDVMTDPKIQQEIAAFFQQYGVKHIAAERWHYRLSSRRRRRFSGRRRLSVLSLLERAAGERSQKATSQVKMSQVKKQRTNCKVGSRILG